MIFADRVLAVAVVAALLGSLAAAQGEASAEGDGEENASNPLASVNNTDVKYQYFDLGGSDRDDFFLDGSYMLLPELKLKYELHYWETDVTGRTEKDWERAIIKPIYFPRTGELARIIHDHADQTPRTAGFAGLSAPAGTSCTPASSAT